MYSLSSTADVDTIIAPKINADKPGAILHRIKNSGATAGEEVDVRMHSFCPFLFVHFFAFLSLYDSVDFFAFFVSLCLRSLIWKFSSLGFRCALVLYVFSMCSLCSLKTFTGFTFYFRCFPFIVSYIYFKSFWQSS